MHKWLIANSYPTVVPQKRFVNEPQAREIADRIGSLSHHPLIKNRLSNTALRIEPTYNKIGSLHLEHVSKLLADSKITGPKKGTPFYTLIASKCLEGYLTHPDFEKECDPLLEALKTEHLQTIRDCLKNQHRLYGSPSDVVDVLKRWKFTLHVETIVTIHDIANRRQY